MLIVNGTDEQIKVCVYKTASVLDNIPCEGGVVFLDPFKSASWQPSQGENAHQFDVRFFHSELIDRLLARAASVERGQSVRLYTESVNVYKTDVSST